MQQSKTVRVNLGCGQTPTVGFVNFDNSPSIRLAHRPLLCRTLALLGLLRREQKAFIAFARQSSIRWADAVNHIPLPDNSADVIYTSHMVEHFDREELGRFLREARRVLTRGGTIRIAVPDLRKQVDRYLQDGDADSFIEGTLLTHARPGALRERIIQFLVGDRHHMWMFDAASLSRALKNAGFKNPRALDAGETTIAEPGELNLHERASESLYVEAQK